MTRRIFTACFSATFALGLATAPAAAQDGPLTGSDIERLLTGNTAEGTWDGASYKSYFDPNGVTIYDAQNADPQEGRWRVNEATDKYESFFEAVGWTEYTVLSTDTGYAWKRNGNAQPFDVVEGNSLGE